MSGLTLQEPATPALLRNRLTVCPECGGMLGADKNAVTSENGYIYRARHCEGCGGVVHTKQAPENFCEYEKKPLERGEEG